MSEMTTNDRVRGNTVEEKEQFILANSRPLCLDGYSLTEYDDSLEDFIHNLLAVYNKKYQTVVAGIVEGTKPQLTRPGAHRSIIDIFLLSKYYFPDCTLRTVIKALYSLGDDNICTQICGTIYRRVYELRVTQTGRWRTELNRSDELGYILEDYKTILNN